MDRYAVFIDGGYAKKIPDQFGGKRISYLKFSQHPSVARNQERLRTYYYDCAPYTSSPPSSDEKIRKANFDRFVARLESESRFQVRLGRLAKHSVPGSAPRFQQKMVDILLAVDLVQLSVQHQIQRAVLLANDSDFVPAIQIAKNAGVVVELYHLNDPKPHTELKNACDDCTVITDTMIQDTTIDQAPSA